jgi:dTDP-4-amino-4,6-dideoxygalactose transaminase
MSFEVNEKFEKKIAKFFGSKYAILTDSCTHALETVLIYLKIKKILVPKNTYISIAFLAKKLGINLQWSEKKWKDYYYIDEKKKVIDAAVYWKKKGYIKNSYMCLSFQFQKHINIGRGGIILLDKKKDYYNLKTLCFDGRKRGTNWRDQDIATYGLHYYMTPEMAQKGLKIFEKKKNMKPKKWTYEDYPDISRMKVFKKKKLFNIIN